MESGLVSGRPASGYVLVARRPRWCHLWSNVPDVSGGSYLALRHNFMFFIAVSYFLLSQVERLPYALLWVDWQGTRQSAQQSTCRLARSLQSVCDIPWR